ncbi:MAG: EAL domain-containing protein [Bacillota bacterium]
MNILIIYDVLLLMTCGLTVACVLYAMQRNFKPLINKLFSLMGCALIIWAFGYALAATARDVQISQIGRRIAPLGWGTIVGFTMHFVLTFTEKHALLKKWWIYPLLYLPGFIAVFSGTILPLFGLNSDIMMHTAYGWINMAELNGWNWFNYAYMFTFISLAFVLLIRWGRRSPAEKAKNQSKIIAHALILATALGIVSDVLPSVLRTHFPSTSAIYMSALVLAISYCISRYRFLQPETASQEELILSKAVRTHVNRYFGLVLLAGAIALFFAGPHLSKVPLTWPVYLIGALVLTCAVFIFLLDRTSYDDKLKEILVSLCNAFLFPLIVLWFADVGVYVVWAFVFPLILICLLFDRQIILSTIIVSALLTQLLEWAYLPTASLNISATDHLVRLCVLVFGAALALYVNKAYTRRLRENANHIFMQGIASEISHSFVSVGEDNLQEKLYCALERCGQFIRCDRAYIALLDEEAKTIRYSVEWTAPGIPSQLEAFEETLSDMHPMMMSQLKTQSVIMLKDVAFLPPMAGKIKKQLIAQGIRAVMTVAIKNKGKIIGFIGFNAGRPMREWNFDSPEFIKIVTGIVSDAVVKVNGEQKLSHMAYHDQLTGLPNRSMFSDKLNQAIEQAKQAKKMVGVAFLDLDAFKSINDTLGHDQGDRLLTEIACTLSGIIRSSDVVSRFGGDEFILLINQISSENELLEIMDRIMALIQKPVVLAGQEFFVSASAGVAVYPQDGDDAETLMKNADTAMYNAKSSGKSRYVMCSQDMKDDILAKIDLTNLLYRALPKDQLLLHFQPQIDITSHAIVGVEALVRWSLPERGTIGPAIFIPLAEQTGLIHAIGDWVLQEACTANRHWHELGCSELRVAVNVSVHQLKNPNFIHKVEDALRKSGLPPKYLELEITESAANGNADNIVVVLHKLKALGVTISIDDFGTQYSSLSRLKQLPIDRIKMDMQFVQGIEKNAKDKAISKVIINLAKSLNLKVIAEGVETAPQLDFLSQRMCDEVQGYYYYKPMSAPDVEGILLKQLHAEQGCS